MIRFIKRVIGLLILFAIILGLFLWLGPRQTVSPNVLRAEFVKDDAGAVQEFLDSEKEFSDIKPGQEKQIIWAGSEGERTEYSVVYLHGFSASLQEIRPVPDLVAEEIGANLIYTRLTGHGQPGTAMGNAKVDDWIKDLGQALRVGRVLGEKTIIISTSTGGTLASAVLTEPAVAENVAGIVYVSPNFALKNPTAKLGNLPMFRVWGPILAGETRSWEASSEQHAQYWTTSYPTKSIIPMMALISHVSKIDVTKTNVPALFIYSDNDQVVDAAVTKDVADRWGGPKARVAPKLTEKDDGLAHVIAGDIISPAQNGPTVAAIVDWVKELK